MVRWWTVCRHPESAGDGEKWVGYASLVCEDLSLQIIAHTITVSIMCSTSDVDCFMATSNFFH